MSELRLVALACPVMVRGGDDLVTLLVDSLASAGESLRENDLVIVTSKVVSKSEGQVVAFDGTDEHKVAIVEGESRRVLRRRGTLRITETHHGFINANAGVDLSNADDGTAILLPKDPDRSARRIRGELARRLGVDVAVLITDTFGRVWRQGVTDVALGSAGLRPVLDLRGTHDATGRLLEATEVAIADEIAGAANLVLHKSAATPFALVRGLDPSFFGPGSVSENIVRSKNDDLFR
ncbi:MAG TPA: coenzyme F420-0:L-glutamate ligase [Acidimicrobiales bacterium]|nr:coenzyme F420-0:L-glutamate ligase [Acidimicrobiales bacterium]